MDILCPFLEYLIENSIFVTFLKKIFSDGFNHFFLLVLVDSNVNVFLKLIIFIFKKQKRIQKGKKEIIQQNDNVHTTE